MASYQKLLTSYENLPRISMFKKHTSRSRTTGIFEAYSGSRVTADQFCASLILPAKDGLAEELEKALGLHFEQDNNFMDYIESDTTMPLTLKGLISRMNRKDYTDSKVPSLCLAFSLSKLEVDDDAMNKEKRHSIVNMNRPNIDADIEDLSTSSNKRSAGTDAPPQGPARK